MDKYISDIAQYLYYLISFFSYHIIVNLYFDLIPNYMR